MNLFKYIGSEKQNLELNRILTLIIVTCILLLAYHKNATAQNVNIPDRNLRAALELALDKEAGADITKEDMASLDSFEANESDIRVITGIEHAVMLTELHLGENSILDLSPLKSLKKLKHLELHRNKIITDISPLKDLTNLIHLSLRGNRIVDISPLKNMTALTFLHLGYNQILDILPLKDLTKLTFLNLDENHISDISPLRKLVELTELHVDDNQITDMSVVKVMTKLTFLNLNDNQIADMSPVKDLIALTFLDLHGNQIRDLSSLKNLKELGGLRFHENQVSDLSPIKNLTKLTFLKLDDNKISNVAPIKNLINLKILYLSGNHILDFSPIEGLLANLEKHDFRNQTPYVNPMDVNRNYVVDVIDLIIVALYYRNPNFADAASFNIYPDVNSDGVVDIEDLIAVAAEIDATAAAPAIKKKLAAEQFIFSNENLTQWIHLAKQLRKQKPYMQKGIDVLESLFSILTAKEKLPETTALLPNYPNPSNPETWIPYQLAKPAEVNISIHSSNGKLVRTLRLGYLPAGIYFSNSRAAYWNGRNESGETVASGIYFYTMIADNFTATSKMLIRK